MHRGEFADLGQPCIPQSAPSPAENLDGIVVKQEATSDHAPNTGAGHSSPVLKRRRDQSKSPTTSSSRPSKRRESTFHRTDDSIDDTVDARFNEPLGDSPLQLSESSSHPAQEIHAIKLNSLEQAQTRVNSRIDTIRDELAVQKTRIEDCQKAVNHNDQERDIGQLETSLKTKVRVQRKRVDELVTRVDELKTSNGGSVSSGLEDQGMKDESLFQVEAQVTDLTKRIVVLEKNQQAGFDKVHRRLDALEVSNSQRASTLETSRAPFERQGAEKKTRYANQGWVAEPIGITLPWRRPAEQWSPLFRHATEQETRFPQYKRATQPSRIPPIQVSHQDYYTTPAPALAPAHAPASDISPALAHIEHTDQVPGHYDGSHQAAQPQSPQGYYRAATRER
jgi:hypothetical protein